MPYRCPRCGQPVSRGYSSSAQMTAGLVGALFYAAFGDFQCKSCGGIPKREFSADDRKKMMLGSTLLVTAAIVLGGLIIAIVAQQ